MERHWSCFLFHRIKSRFQLYVYFGIFYSCIVSEQVREFLYNLLFDWLISSNWMIPIVSLNYFNQSIPSSGVISFLSVISNVIFCLLFSYSMSTGLFPRYFTSFLFTSWYLCSLFEFRFLSLFCCPSALLILVIRCL